MKKRILPLCLVLLLALSACGDKKVAEVTPSPSPTPSATAAPSPEVTQVPEYTGPRNPLTGLPIASDQAAQQRPIAIMLNNLKAALPQLGVSQADIIYEVLAEGGITRMLGVYQSVEGVGTIGSVRSSRPYYLELALGHDAVYLHAGGSPDAYAKIKEWGVTALDCVNGPYEGSLFWRDGERRKNNGYEHSVITSGETILKLFPTYQFRKEHQADYTYEMQFAPDGTPPAGVTANTITVPFSSYKTGVFRYDIPSKRYLIEEYGKKYIDGNGGEQVGVTNVLVLKTSCTQIKGDDYGRITVDLTSGGTGYFACGGQLMDIQWSKNGRDGQLNYTDLSGQPITLGQGHSYVCIVPQQAEVTVE